MKKYSLLFLFILSSFPANAQVISSLDALTLDASDKFYGVDVSDTTLGAGGSGKQFTLQHLRNKEYDYVSISSTTTVSPNQFASVTTTGTDLTITLPASPTIGQKQGFAYVGQTFGDVVTIARNGETINRLAADLKLYVADTSVGKIDQVEFVYDGSGWIIHKDSITPLGATMDLTTAAHTGNTSGATTTAIPFDSISNKFGDMWDSTNYKITILRSGLYNISFRATNENAMSTQQLIIGSVRDVSTTDAYISGDRVAWADNGAASDIFTSIGSGTIWLNEGTELEMVAFFIGANLGLKATSGFNGSGTRWTIREIR